MFERFTDRSRRVVVLAQEEARLLGHSYIGTEHILLGLIHEEEGVAARSLDALGISLEAVRDEVQQVVGPEASSPSGHIPFTPRAKKVLELSLREALQLGHNYIGTEHILLGLLREGEGLAAQVLVTLGVDLSRVREQVIQLLSGYARFTPTRSATRSPAASRANRAARVLAAGGTVGTHHQLLALLAEEASLAAKVLASFGVTRQAAEARVDEIGVEGSSDESPEEAGARSMQLRVSGERLEIVVSGTDPAAAHFPQLWKALQTTTRDLVQRFAVEPEWRAEGWGPEALAGYVVRSQGDGPAGHLMLSSTEVDEDEVRTLVASWAEEQLAQAKTSRTCASFSLVVERGAEGELVVRHFTIGRHADRKLAPRRPLRELLAFAAADLRHTA